jgi:hypothetical protein
MPTAGGLGGALPRLVRDPRSQMWIAPCPMLDGGDRLAAGQHSPELRLAHAGSLSARPGEPGCSPSTSFTASLCDIAQLLLSNLQRERAVTELGRTLFLFHQHAVHPHTPESNSGPSAFCWRPVLAAMD